MYTQYGVNQTKSTVGGLSVGVPGEIRGENETTHEHILTLAWQMLHERHGSLPWEKLFEPAINIARNGFPVNYDLELFLVNREFIVKDKLWSEVYAPQGVPVKQGDTVYRHSYATTLERIAREGPDVFYKDSSIADNIIQAVQASGGIMTHEDLAGYQPILRNASTISYR